MLVIARTGSYGQSQHVVERRRDKVETDSAHCFLGQQYGRCDIK